jgi:uncharacterized protein involved in exopolysaccharide biosynthesis
MDNNNGQLFDKKLLSEYNGKKYLIAIVVLICTSISLIFSFIVKPRYKAKASFFVPLNTSLENALSNPQFGFDIEADRLLQLLNSEQIKDSVVKKFYLTNYFEIDTLEYAWRDKLTELFRKRIICFRTNVMSIVIEVETYDPIFSKQIAAYMLDVLQKCRERLLKTNSGEAIISFKNMYEEKKNEVDTLYMKIAKLREKINSSRVMLTNVNVNITTNSNTKNQPEEIELEVMSQKYINENNRLNELKGKYENALNIYNSPITKFYVIDNAYPIYTKSFPLIQFNVIITFFGSALFMFLGIYLKHILENRNQNG